MVLCFVHSSFLHSIKIIYFSIFIFINRPIIECIRSVWFFTFMYAYIWNAYDLLLFKFIFMIFRAINFLWMILTLLIFITFRWLCRKSYPFFRFFSHIATICCVSVGFCYGCNVFIVIQSCVNTCAFYCYYYFIYFDGIDLSMQTPSIHTLHTDEGWFFELLRLPL